MPFEIHGQKDRRYRIERALNLPGWEPLATLLATNTTTIFTEADSPGGMQPRFYRAITLP